MQTRPIGDVKRIAKLDTAEVFATGELRESPVECGIDEPSGWNDRNDNRARRCRAGES